MPAVVKFKRPPKRRTISQAAADRRVAPKAGPVGPAELPKLPRMKGRPKKARPQRPTERMSKEKGEKDHRGEALSLVAQAALAMPGKSKTGKILKGAVSGAAIGGQLGLAVEKYRASRKAAKPRGSGRAKLSQEAVSKPHAKPTKKPKKEETV